MEQALAKAALETAKEPASATFAKMAQASRSGSWGIDLETMCF